LVQQVQQQQQQAEFSAAQESRSGRQLLQSAANDDNKLLCNITDKMLLYVENITILQDGKPVWSDDDRLNCDRATADSCQDNGTVYVILHSHPFVYYV